MLFRSLQSRAYQHSYKYYQITSQIHDFARAYGSLCWNLSKVIPRKDLPKIHTMCLPGGQSKRGGESTAKGSLFHIGSDQLQDLEETREEVCTHLHIWCTHLYDKYTLYTTLHNLHSLSLYYYTTPISIATMLYR
jgi:hypothetical protein